MAAPARGDPLLPWAEPWAGTGNGPGMPQDVGMAFPNTEFAQRLPGTMGTTAAAPLYPLKQERGILGSAVTTGQSGSSAIVDNGKVMCTHQFTTRRAAGDADLFVRENQLMFMGVDDETLHHTQHVLVQEARTLSSVNTMLFWDAFHDLNRRANQMNGEMAQGEYSNYHGFVGVGGPRERVAGLGTDDNNSLFMRPDAFRMAWRPYGVCMAVSTSDEAELTAYSVVSHTESISGWARVLNYWGVCGFDVDLWLAVVLVFVKQTAGVFESGDFATCSYEPLTGTKPLPAFRAVGADGAPDDGRMLRYNPLGHNGVPGGATGVYCWQVVPVSTLQRGGPTASMLQGKIVVDHPTDGAGNPRHIKWQGYAMRVGSSNFNHLQGARDPGRLEVQAQAARALTHPFRGTSARDCLDNAYTNLASTNAMDVFLGM